MKRPEGLRRRGGGLVGLDPQQPEVQWVEQSTAEPGGSAEAVRI